MQNTNLSEVPIYKRRIFIVLVSIAVLAIVGATIAVIALKPGAEPTVNQTTNERVLMSAKATAVEGKAEYSADGSAWQPLAKDAVIAQGSSVRTDENGRAVITFDDGSVVRLNGSTRVQFTSLSTENIVVDNQAGEVYARVVASAHLFNVTVGEETYTALGTAFKTINTADSKGVEVYESKVKVKVAAQTVDEGKRHYGTNPVAELKNKVTDIPQDQLQKDAFLKWNLDQDKSVAEFADKLGYLMILEKAADEALAQAAAASASGVAPRSGTVPSSNARSTTPPTGTSQPAQPATQPTQPTNPAPTGTINFFSTGSQTVGWILSGSAPYGVKIVWSTAPGVGYPGIKVQSHPATSNTSTQLQFPGSGTYYVRACMTYENTCLNYSNEFTVTKPE